MGVREQSDEVLMLAYVDGDQAAFQAIFERFSPRLIRLMRRQVRSEDDARDLVQQTFLQLHRARNDFRRDALLRPWLFTIALNLRREYFRKLGRRRETELDLNRHDSAIDEVPLIERKETAMKVRRALKQLPAKQREVIELHWLEELKFNEVAQIVGAKLSAVKVRAHRGYAKMRKILEAEEKR